MTVVARYITKHGMITPIENIRRHAMFSSTEEKTNPDTNPRHIPTLVFEVVVFVVENKWISRSQLKDDLSTH
jgi:hypothetical protein